MYESATYEELKSLPKEQKPNAWKELRAMYSTQKELALKLGVSPAIVYNMISRYAKDDINENEKEMSLKPVRTLKRTRKRAKKADNQDKPEQIVSITEAKPVFEEIPKIAANNENVTDTFSIFIKKILSGEDAQFLLNGIGGTLLKGQKYTVEIKITEK